MRNKRDFLRTLSAFIVLRATRGWAVDTVQNPSMVPAGNLDSVLQEVLSGQKAQPSDQVVLTIPRVAENGAMVPVTLESLLPLTTRLILLAEMNPGPLLASFKLTSQLEPFVSTRVKLNASGNVMGIAEAGGQFYVAVKPVAVMVGGCR